MVYLLTWPYVLILKITVILMVILELTILLVFIGAPDKPCGVGRADANPKLLLNDT